MSEPNPTSHLSSWTLERLERWLPPLKRGGHGSPQTELGGLFALETPVGERSERTFQLVATAYESGINLGDTVDLLTGHQLTVDKYQDRTTTEVARCWAKLSDDPVATGCRARALAKAQMSRRTTVAD